MISYMNKYWIYDLVFFTVISGLMNISDCKKDITRE